MTQGVSSSGSRDGLVSRHCPNCFVNMQTIECFLRAVMATGAELALHTSPEVARKQSRFLSLFPSLSLPPSFLPLSFFSFLSSLPPSFLPFFLLSTLTALGMNKLGSFGHFHEESSRKQLQKWHYRDLNKPYVVLILLVLILNIKTIYMLCEEKRTSEHKVRKRKLK